LTDIVSDAARLVTDVAMSEATRLVTDVVMSQAAPLPLQYPVKCEPDHVQLKQEASDDLKPHHEHVHYQHHRQQQQPHRGVLDEVPFVVVASNVPSSIAVVTSPSLFSADQTVLYQRHDGAASRNVTPVKCMSCLVNHALCTELVLLLSKLLSVVVVAVLQ